jgi:hypothetical protein
MGARVPPGWARLVAWALLAASTTGCGASGEPHDPPPATTHESPPTTTHETPPTTTHESPPTTTSDPGADDPLADLAAPVGEDEVVDAHPSTLAHPELAPGVCQEVAEAPVRVLPRSSAMSVVATRDRFYLAGYEPLEGGREQVSVVELVAGQAPRLVVAIPLESAAASARTAPPGLALVGAAGSEADELGVAWIEGNGGVRAAFFEPSRPAAHPIALSLADADRRFAPAIARVGPHRVIAATIAIAENVAEGEPPRTAMRMHLERLGPTGERLGQHDVSPRAGSGSHPLFAPGPSGRPDLFFVDARVALSVIHRVAFDAESVPGETTVARPINLSAEPPSIAVVRVGGRDLAAYAAVGNMATRAVGIVEIGGTDSPDPLVAGLGYGQPLTVRGLSRTTDAVFASEAPSAVAADAPHEVRVRTVRVNESGARVLGEPLVFSGATRPALAIDGDGAIAVALEGGLVRFVRCG